MFLNIITPCSRPQNLHLIAESINIPKENYRWIVVFDADEIPDEIPDICEPYTVKVIGSISGNAQRNFALDLITDGHVYFNDDDTIIQSTLWDEIKEKDADFISFKQANKDGSVRLEGIEIKTNYIDSHNFITSVECIKSRWVLDRYDADGIFASECFKNAKQHLYIPKVLSVYNFLKEHYKQICEF
jgi:hypothetical protein